MASFIKAFLLFSIFIKAYKCQDSTNKDQLRQDLLISLICIFLMLLIILIVGCTILQCKIMTKGISSNNSSLSAIKTELKPYAIQTRCVETRIVLSSSQDHMSFPEQTLSQLPSQVSPSQQPSHQLHQQPHQLSSPPPEDPEPDETTALLLKQKPGVLSTGSIYLSHSNESIHSSDSGDIYSLDNYELVCLNSMNESFQDEKVPEVTEEHEEITESGSFMLCKIHKK